MNVTEEHGSNRAREEKGSRAFARRRRVASFFFFAKPSLQAPRVAARLTTPPSEKRALPEPRRSRGTQSPTSFMRRASHSSSPQGVGRETETRTARRRDARSEKAGGAAASSRNEA